MNFLDTVTAKVQEPYYWRHRRLEALHKVNEFFSSHSDADLTEMLLAKLTKAREEYGEEVPPISRQSFQDNIEEEIIDLTGWAEAFEFSQTKYGKTHN